MGYSLRYTRNLFLRSFCIVYLFAFTSLYIQLPGLYGDNGILPAKTVLDNVKYNSFSSRVHYKPTLLWLAPYVGLNVNYALDVLCLFGILLAFTGFVSQKFCIGPVFASLWSLYFSIIQVGQTFMTRNYDDLLLEVGFLAFLAAPFSPSQHRKGSVKDRIIMWLLRWLLFRFTFTNGISKLLSGCPKWRSLTALQYFFQTSPLPTPLSWYFHSIPIPYQNFATIIVLTSELIFPILAFYSHIRSIRITTFVVQVVMQVLMSLGSNFGMLNLIMVVLNLALMDDEYFFGRKTAVSKWRLMGRVINAFILGSLAVIIATVYQLRQKGKTIEGMMYMNERQFDTLLWNVIVISSLMALVSLTFVIMRSFYSVWSAKLSMLLKFFSLFSIVLYTTIALLLVVISTVPLLSLHRNVNMTIDPAVHVFYSRFHKTNIVNPYGMFRRIVGVNGRQEIVFEGANHIDGPWKEYNFLYKPGDVNFSLPFVAPYSPRLDWNLHWAAYSSYEKQPWTLSFIHRLLNGHQEVFNLLNTRHSPFTANTPPKYIRATLYQYKLTTGHSQRASSSAWWTREKLREYAPPYTKDAPQLVQFLKARDLLPVPVIKRSPVHPVWKQILDTVRSFMNRFEPTILCLSIIMTGFVIIITRN